jgi:hypothetical protein
MHLLTCRFVLRQLLVCMSLLTGLVMAQTPDSDQIRKAMMAVFDKPSDPLKVNPVVVQGGYAVTGWIQGERGGRAVLHKVHGQWHILVCGGDGLREATVLTQTGMSAGAAFSLAKSLASAEARLPPDVLKKLGLFDGIVKVDAVQGVHHHNR